MHLQPEPQPYVPGSGEQAAIRYLATPPPRPKSNTTLWIWIILFILGALIGYFLNH